MKITRSACAVSFLLGVTVCHAAILSNPVITQSAPGFDATYGAGNVFDSMDIEYASQSRGYSTSLSTSEGTFIEFDFGQAVTIDQFINVTRRNPVDVIFTERLTFSNDPIFDGTDSFVDLSPAGSNGNGFIKSFAAQTARYVRWQVYDGALNAGNNNNNFGSAEMRFLKSSPSLIRLTPTVYNGAAAFNPDYALANAVNGDAGRTGAGIGGIEYASAGLGPNMFVDFDMGSVQPIAGFDFYDRFGSIGGNLVDRVNAFDLLFSNDPTFSSGVTTKQFTPGAWGYNQTFSPVMAQYVRLDATSVAGPNANTGIQEITFYAAPEPSTALLFLCGSVACARRRRRA